ncbi:hypothetical protein YC2023_044912 [Brassica napus]
MNIQNHSMSYKRLSLYQGRRIKNSKKPNKKAQQHENTRGNPNNWTQTIQYKLRL